MSNNILVIDDASTVRLFYRSALSSINCAVAEAYNGAEALELLYKAEQQFNLILLDINMPQMDGYEFLKIYRDSELYQAPVIMISTEARENDAIRAYEAGANLYLVKPVTTEILVTVASLLTNNRVQS